MPNGYYIIDGWVSQAELFLSGTLLTSFPTQVDMTNGRRWVRPGNLADVVKPVRIIDVPSGQRFAYGGLTFAWPLQVLSPKMVDYIHSTYFSDNNDTFFYRSYSRKLTVQTYNRASGDWETYWVFGKFPDFTNEAEVAAGGYNNFQIKFVAWAVAPTGPDIALTLDVASYLEDTINTFTLTATNVGDSDTIDAVVIVWEIDTTDTNYESITVPETGSFTVEYSTNNQAAWVSSEPATKSDITHVRITINDTMDPDQAIAFTLQIYIESGVLLVDQFFSSTTSGDNNDTNDDVNSSESVTEFDPTEISSLGYWFAADANVYDAPVGGSLITIDGTGVGRWETLAGASSDATQGEVGKRPQWQADYLVVDNAAINFDGTDDFLEDATLEYNDPSFTVIVAYSPDGVSEGNLISTAASNGVAIWETTSRGAATNQAAVEAYGTVVPFTLTKPSGFRIAAYTFNEADEEVTLFLNDPFDNNETVTLPLSGFEDYEFDGIRIGAFSDGVGNFDGRIAEVLFFDDILDLFSIRAVFRYFETKYNRTWITSS